MNRFRLRDIALAIVLALPTLALTHPMSSEALTGTRVGNVTVNHTQIVANAEERRMDIAAR